MRRRLLTTIGISLAAICTAFFTSCGSDDSSSARELDNEDANEYSSFYTNISDTLAYRELYYNHFMLGLVYYNANLNHELNSDVNVYYGIGLTNGYSKGACTERFADVCSMYDQMSDSYTQYFDPSYAQIVYSYLTETDEVVGIGVEVIEETDSAGSHLEISEVYANSPADKMGLMEGDIIVSVDGTVPATASAFEKLTTGSTGETVKITVQRDGENTTYVVELASFNEPSVHLSYADSIPVIKIDQFVTNTTSDSGSYGEFMTALTKVMNRGAKSAIIDLRDNPGGATDQCANIAAEMLNKGDTLYTDYETGVDSSTGRYVQKFDTLTYMATVDGKGKDLYYVFLADTGSASCSEFMMAAVTTNKHTPVVGMVTFGKGIGQLYFGTYAGGLGAATDMHSVDKNGNAWHKYGLVPDYELTDPDEQMAKAVELAKGMKEKRTAGYGTVSTGNFEKSHATGNSRKDILRNSGYYRIKR